MCSPEHFAVEYAINPWMDVTASVDVELAVKQWDRLRETLVDLGHEVHLLVPEPGLPDMVYAANGAFMVDGTVYGAQFKHQQRPPRRPRTGPSTSRRAGGSSRRTRRTRARATSRTCRRRTAG